MLPGSSAEQKDTVEHDDQLGTSPPLELRRPASTSRPTIAVPHSLQSPQDRATGKPLASPTRRVTIHDTHASLRFADSPQVAQVYVHGSRIPHPHYPDVGSRFYENARAQIQPTSEPPPAHRNPISAPSPVAAYASVSVQPPPANELPSHMHSKLLEREREQRELREREKEQRKASIPGNCDANRIALVSMPCPSSLVPAPPGRSLQVATPPHASQVPPQADSLLMLLQRYPVMWQGLLALKTDQAAVQMHFVFGNPQVASGSLPCNSDGSTPPLRIAQRMRLEQTQLEGVARKMQVSSSPPRIVFDFK